MTDEKTVPTKPASGATEGEGGGRDSMNVSGTHGPETRKSPSKAPSGSRSPDASEGGKSATTGDSKERKTGSPSGPAQSIANDGSATPLKGGGDAEEVMKANPGPAAAAARGDDAIPSSGDRFLTNRPVFPAQPPGIQPSESREDYKARLQRFEADRKAAEKDGPTRMIVETVTPLVRDANNAGAKDSAEARQMTGTAVEQREVKESKSSSSKSSSKSKSGSKAKGSK